MRPDENDQDAKDGEPVEPEIEIPRAPFIPPPPEIRFDRPTLGRGTPGRAFSRPQKDENGKIIAGPEGGEQTPSHLGASLVIGITFPACVIVGAAIGLWIDHEWPVAEPWGVVVMSLAGIAAGLMNVFRVVALLDKQQKKNSVKKK